MLVFAGTLSLCPAAQAWQNGPVSPACGRTTVQQWILQQAAAEASRSGCDWLQLSAALQTVGLPDTRVHDFRYHLYEHWNGQRKGAAPERASVYFALVRDALATGDTDTASRLFGMLAHYYTDASDPLHTAACRAERRMHRPFELRVMTELSHRRAFEQRVVLRIVRSDALAAARGGDIARAAVGQDIARYTARSAKRAHRAYRLLVRTYLRHGFCRTVRRSAATTLVRAVHGVASLLVAATQPTPDQSEPTGTHPLLSRGRPATACSQDVMFHAARFADDGDDLSSWIATSSSFPQWWQVDLGSTRELASVAIAWFRGDDRCYAYDVKVSTDGKKWHQVVDQSDRSVFGDSDDPLTGAHARYVRIEVLSYIAAPSALGDAEDSGPAAIAECSVYGADSSPDPTPSPSVTPSETPTPTESPSASSSATPTPSASPTASPSASPTASPSVSPSPSSTPKPSPTPTASPTPTGDSVVVPGGATTTTINSCVAKAVAQGAGTTLVFPAGKFSYSGTFVVPDGIDVKGQGIWDQGVGDGSGGTWLQCSRGMTWGSDCSVARGSSSAGADTKTNGSHDVVFSFVRFKGGSNDGSPLIELGGNFNSLWSSSVKRIDMVDTTFNDCELERPQSTNATDGTSKGAILNIWLDSRAGGGQVHDLHFNRCHFGVKNGYNGGTDGYGMGRCILFQPAPAEHGSDGPRPSGKPDNMGFDWSQVTHGFSNTTFADCLFEYSTWYPMDVCDYARSYSLTTSFGGVVGSNPPTATQAGLIPARMWNVGFDMTRCYFKGSSSSYHVVGEIGKDCTVVDCGGTSVSMHAGSYGNTLSGAFSNSRRPHTVLFTTDWTGTGTSYTASPYDP